MNNRNYYCSCKPKKDKANNNNVNVNSVCSKKIVFDSNLQMTNHYKRVNSAKCIVDTTPPKCYVSKQKQLGFNSHYSTPTLLSLNDSRIASRANSNCEVRYKCNKPKPQTERSSSVPPPPRPATRRNPNLVPQNYLKQTAYTQIRINNIEKKIPLKCYSPAVRNPNKVKTDIKKIVKNDPSANSTASSPKNTKKPTPNINTCSKAKQIKAPVPTPRTVATFQKPHIASDYEYLQFSLRITEDIIRNDLYAPKEMRRVFNSHLEANRGRLNMHKMLLQIDHLCKELDIQNKSSRGDKKCCKNDCVNSSATNDCSLDLDTKNTLHENGNKKDLLNKIFNGHVMTDEEIHNLSEDDLQDVITEILNDHQEPEASMSGEIIEISSLHDENENTFIKDDSNSNFDLIHNNAVKFRNPSEENLKVLSDQTSEESLNASKQVENDSSESVGEIVSLSGNISDFLQKVSMRITENIVKHNEEKLAAEQLKNISPNIPYNSYDQLVEENTLEELVEEDALKSKQALTNGDSKSKYNSIENMNCDEIVDVEECSEDSQQEQNDTINSGNPSKEQINELEKKELESVYSSAVESVTTSEETESDSDKLSNGSNENKIIEIYSSTSEENQNVDSTQNPEQNSYILPPKNVTDSVSRRTSLPLPTTGDNKKVVLKRGSFPLSTAEEHIYSNKQVEKEKNPTVSTYFQKLAKENEIFGLKQNSAQAISVLEDASISSSEPSIKLPLRKEEGEMADTYSAKHVTKVFDLSDDVDNCWIVTQEKCGNEEPNVTDAQDLSSEVRSLYFNDRKDLMSDNIQLFLDQLSSYGVSQDLIDNEVNIMAQNSKENHSQTFTDEDIEDLIKTSVNLYDNYGIFSSDSLSDEGKNVYEIDSNKIIIAKTLSKLSLSKTETKTEKDKIISSITKFILDRTFAALSPIERRIEEPREEPKEDKIDFISTVEKLVNDKTNDLYQYCIPEDNILKLEFPSKTSLDDLNKYETEYSKSYSKKSNYKSSKRKSSNTTISEGEISKSSSASSFSRKVDLHTVKKSEPDILQHLKKYESKPKEKDKNPLTPSLHDYELKIIEDKQYENYIPKFNKSRFYPTVSTQTSSTDFKYNGGFNDNLLSDGEVQNITSDEKSDSSESFSR